MGVQGKNTAHTGGIADSTEQVIVLQYSAIHFQPDVGGTDLGQLVDTFQQNGVPVSALYATGGIPKKNPMAMQIMADVLGMPIYIAAPDQGPALGSAIFGAVAAGVYESPAAAIRTMSYVEPEPYQPIAANSAVYEALYQEYKRLHDSFGRGENNVMKRLKALANRV